MEVTSKKKMMLVAGRGNLELSKEIAACLEESLGNVVLSTFANGEL